MARDKGTFPFSSNFEVLNKAPLDARMLVSSYANLTDPSVWQDADNLVWLYDGAIVSVSGDAISDNDGLYFLNSAITYEQENSWTKIGTNDSSLYSAKNINTDDPSLVSLFTEIDASGNLLFNKLGAAGGITIMDDGLGGIWITTDASYSGQANYGSNISGGDASIYFGMSGDALRFRPIAGGNNITVSTVGDVITVNVDGANLGVNGGVFVTNVTPTSGGNVNITSTSSNGEVVESILTDTQNVNIEVTAVTGNTNLIPVVTIDGVAITLSGTEPLYKGTLNLDLNDVSSLTVLHEDGAEHTIDINYEAVPVILDASFYGGYPGFQTELNATDTFEFSLTTDVDVTSITVLQAGAADAQVYSTSGTEHNITINIANQGNVAVLRGISLYVEKATGARSETYVTSNHGNIDGVHVVNCNNLSPTITIGEVIYPTNMGAIQHLTANDGNAAYVINDVENFTTLLYSSPNGELTPLSSSTEQTPKKVTYLTGGYNTTTHNFKIEAWRSTNGTYAEATTVVKIADDAATVSVQSAGRYISAGNDGTNYGNPYEHTINLTTDQELNQVFVPTLTMGAQGSWKVGEEFSGAGTSWSNIMLVHDDMSKGVQNWGALTVTNLAGIVTTVTSPGNYTLGGFVERIITLDAFADGGDINVQVSDPYITGSPSGKLNFLWSFKPSVTTRAFDETTSNINVPNTWVVDSAAWQNPTTIKILDSQAYGANGATSTITISESA